MNEGGSCPGDKLSCSQRAAAENLPRPLSPAGMGARREALGVSDVTADAGALKATRL